MNRKLTREDIEKIATARNHTVVSFDNYQNVHSEIQSPCNTCSTTWITTAHRYKNAKKTGCPECKKRTASETHKGKVTSVETKRKIGAKASQRPGSLTGKAGTMHPRFKGGVARDFKNPSVAHTSQPASRTKITNAKQVVKYEQLEKCCSQAL